MGIDQERLALWSCSAGVPLGVRAAFWGTPAFIKCFVAYYGPLDLQGHQTPWELTNDEVRDFSAITYLEEHPEKLAPLLIIKAGIDHPVLNASIDHFVAQASAKNVELDYLIHPTGHHAFDVLNDVPRSHDIIRRTLEFLKTSLTDESTRSV